MRTRTPAPIPMIRPVFSSWVPGADSRKQPAADRGPAGAHRPEAAARKPAAGPGPGAARRSAGVVVCRPPEPEAVQVGVFLAQGALPPGGLPKPPGLHWPSRDCRRSCRMPLRQRFGLRNWYKTWSDPPSGWEWPLWEPQPGAPRSARRAVTLIYSCPKAAGGYPAEAKALTPAVPSQGLRPFPRSFSCASC